MPRRRKLVKKDTRPELLNVALRQNQMILVERDPDGVVRIRQQRAECVCFIKAADITDDFLRALKNDSRVRSAKLDGEYWRVGWKDRWICKDMCDALKKKGVQTYEGDVNPIRRWMTDTRPRLGKHRIGYIDIETDSRVRFSEKEEARILCWTVVGTDGTKKVGVLKDDTDHAEAELLGRLIAVLQNYDLLAAWNGDRFDFEVIFARIEKHRLNFTKARWLWLDQMELFKSMNTGASESGAEKQSYALQAIATALLGEGKDDFDASKTWEAWEAGGDERRRMVRYCVKDTDLLRRIEEKTGFIGLLQTLSELCNVFPDSRGSRPTVQAEGFLLMLGADQGYRFPTAKIKKGAEKYKGAYVMEPQVKGITKNVHVADFASLYPSIIATWNMSPETIVVGEEEQRLIEVHDQDGAPWEDEFSFSPLTFKFFRTTGGQGILPHAVREVMRLRKHWNQVKSSLPPGTPEWTDANRKSTAYKIAANSFYGVIGSPMSRFFDRHVAESITQCGKWLIQETIKEAVARGMVAVYGDTDSVFVAGASRKEFEDFVKWCNEEFYPKVLKRMGCQDNLISLAYEKEFERIVFTAAKKYCNPPETPIWMADGTFKQLGEIVEGDEVAGWEDGTAEKRAQLVPSRVVKLYRRETEMVEVTMASGRKFRCTPDHRWRTGRMRQNSPYIEPKVGRTLAHVVTDPGECPTHLVRDAAWLGGMFDGEGSLCSGGRGQIVISQCPTHNPEVCQRLRDVLTRLNFRFTEWTKPDGTSGTFAIKAGDNESSRDVRLRFMRWCRPVKAERILPAVFKSRFCSEDRIVSVEPCGSGEVIGMTTTTGNYVAHGYASKNCGRYVHYKGTDATDDSKPEVKGLEYKRGDSIKLTRDMQAEVVDLLVGMRKGGHEDPDTFVEVVERWQSRILNDPIELDDVLISKSLSKPLKDYAVRFKNNGDPYRQLPHIEVAKQLAEKGQDVSEGTKIFYYIHDAAHPDGALYKSAAEWSGHVDRYEVWDKMAYPPTFRLLQAAFPDFNWKKWARTRPRKTRAKKSPAQA